MRRPTSGCAATPTSCGACRLRSSQTIEELDGLDRFHRARQRGDMMASASCWTDRRAHHAVPHGDRSGVPIEPFLTDQWYVDAKKLAEPAIKASRGPQRSSSRRTGKDLFRLDGEHPALVHLRQLWWGHRIPPGTARTAKIFVEESEEDARGGRSGTWSARGRPAP
jgi:valyl-tRNA synthetase